MKVLIDGGGVSFFVQAGIIFLAIALVTVYGLRDWASQGSPVKWFAFALCATGGIFCTVGEWHLITNRSAVFLAGRFMGTTANPQHAAVLISLCSLGVFYFLLDFQKLKWSERLLLICLGLSMLHLLILTGSRTGLGIAVIGGALLLRGRLTVAGVLSIASIVAFVWILQYLGLADNAERLVSAGDTRTEIWKNQWKTFMQYPIFGSPFQGEHFRVAENSWLGLMAVCGVFGVMCLTWLLASFCSIAISLWKYRKNISLELDINFCLACVFAVFSGSFFEGYLLGTITFPVLFIACISVVSELTIYRAAFGRVWN